ncbi:MAG: hypothetical protein HY897_12125 [Deltaproteobacteria bacterium]|nr:hypothetical protein [Deltaproteobacteria bacterium]
MNKTTKATLWIIGVFAALSLGVYFAGCGDDEAADIGTGGETPAKCAAAGDACETAAGVKGKCLEVTGSDPQCFGECTTVGDACDLGGCYYTADGNFCFEAGTKAAGEACGAAAECVVGVQCLDQGGMFCWTVCTEDGDCTEPAVCTDTTLGFSVCAEASE